MSSILCCNIEFISEKGKGVKDVESEEEYDSKMIVVNIGIWLTKQQNH